MKRDCLVGHTCRVLFRSPSGQHTKTSRERTQYNDLWQMSHEKKSVRNFFRFFKINILVFFSLIYFIFKLNSEKREKNNIDV